MKRNLDEIGKTVKFSKHNQAESEFVLIQLLKPLKIQFDGD